jgi:oxygen-dependent protoporphyrinogen oxidase
VASVPPGERADVIVLGAGISGLAAARALARAGRRPVVLEAAAAPGGVMATVAQAGYLAELGPNTVQEAPALLELAADAECGGDLVPASTAARKRFVVHRGRLVALPSGPRGLLTTPLLSFGGKARLATEPWRRRGPGPHESVAAFFHRRLGREALPLADAMGLGVFAGDPEELAIGFAFGRAYALEREHGSLLRGLVHAARRGARPRSARVPRHLLGFRGGFAALAARLAAGLDVRYGWQALSVAHQGPGDDFLLLATQEGNPRALSAPRLVSALPAAATAAVLAPLAGAAGLETSTVFSGVSGIPGGSGASGVDRVAAIAAIPHAPVAVVALGYAREQVLHPLDGFGFLAPHREGRNILGCLFSSTLFPDRAPAGRVLLTAIAGGRRQPGLVELADADLFALVRRELGALLGVSGEPEMAVLRRWQPGIPQPIAAWQTAREAALTLEETHPGLTVLGSWLRGVGLPDCARAGWEIRS